MLKKIIGKIWKILPSLARLKLVRGTQTKFTVSAAAIITNEAGEVLLLNHVLRLDSGWGLPGGFLSGSEQAGEAVRREIREETGLELKQVRLLRAQTSSRHIEILFRAEAVGTASVKSREINSLGWFRLEDIPEDLNQYQKSVIRESLKNNL